jgi:peptidylprolyl isomerase
MFSSDAYQQRGIRNSWSWYMAQAQAGDKVRVHYTGKFDDGTVFDSSQGGAPLEFTIGEGQVIPGFEKAVVGMNPGDKKTEKIPADNAYGPYMEEMVLKVERNQVPADFDPKIGDQLAIQNPEGQAIPVIITDVDDENITLDANHPLAGQDLTFEIELVEIGSKLITL